MANTPCARLTKPIRPIVTERPTEITYSTAPKARPRNSVLMRPERISIGSSGNKTPAGAAGVLRFSRVTLLLLVDFLPRILDRGDGLELHVGEMTTDLAYLAHVLVLHDVARFRIDGDRPARAVRILPALPDRHRLVRVHLALLLDHGVEDGLHRVPGADRDEVRPRVRAVLLLVGGDERLVRRPVPCGGVVEHREHADRDVAHVRQLLIGGDVARPDQLDAVLGEAEVAERLHQRGGGLAGRHEDEERVGLRILHALQERAKSEVGGGMRTEPTTLPPASL